MAGSGWRWVDEFGHDWTPGCILECPGHGQMSVLTYDGTPFQVQCRTCGKQPIDLLEDVPLMPTTREWIDHELGGPAPLAFDLSIDLGSTLPKALV